MKIYLSAQLRDRAELWERFMAVRLCSASVVRWSDCPLPSAEEQEEQFVAVCDDLENDARCRKLQAKGVPMVSSKWLRACVLHKRILPLPAAGSASSSSSSSATTIAAAASLLKFPEPAAAPTANHHKKPPRILQVVGAARLSVWTLAEDDVVRAIHAFKQKGDMARASRFESLLVSTTRSRQDVKAREAELF